jgi:hypothetical protein
VPEFWVRGCTCCGVMGLESYGYGSAQALATAVLSAGTDVRPEITATPTFVPTPSLALRDAAFVNASKEDKVFNS